jgi:hypothetical protein
MKRRGFLRALLGVAAAPVVAQAAALLPTPQPKPLSPLFQSQPYETYTFRRNPGYFDLVTYTGDGERKTLPRSSFEPTLIILKCMTAASPWYVLESEVLPPEMNKPGERYIAYEFGEEAMGLIEKHLTSEHFVRI